LVLIEREEAQAKGSTNIKHKKHREDYTNFKRQRERGEFFNTDHNYIAEKQIYALSF